MRAVRVLKKVESAGTLRLDSLPLPEGQMLEVIVLPIEDDMDDLVKASESATGFWDNEIDDRAWNGAVPLAREEI